MTKRFISVLFLSTSLSLPLYLLSLPFLPSLPSLSLSRVAVVGNVDAGKSTLLGVLTHGELDNGRGHARQRLFRHKHEMESGRTSSVGSDILGFDGKGQVVNKSDGHGECVKRVSSSKSPLLSGELDWAYICRASSKVITFIDLAGHEKYLKTTIFGMTGHALTSAC